MKLTDANPVRYFKGRFGFTVLVVLASCFVFSACNQTANTPVPTATVSSSAIDATPTLASTAIPIAAITTTVVPTTEKLLPTRLVIADLSLDAPVIEVGWRVVSDTTGTRTTEYDIAENAAGRHRDSGWLGTAGNIVISGHNNIKGKIFEALSRDVDQPDPRLKPGSDIELFAQDGRKFTYRVQEINRLPETSANPTERLAHGQYMRPTEDATLTLITCWPPDGNTHRIVVVAKLVTPST